MVAETKAIIRPRPPLPDKPSCNVSTHTHAQAHTLSHTQQHLPATECHASPPTLGTGHSTTSLTQTQIVVRTLEPCLIELKIIVSICFIIFRHELRPLSLLRYPSLPSSTHCLRPQKKKKNKFNQARASPIPARARSSDYSP